MAAVLVLFSGISICSDSIINEVKPVVVNEDNAGKIGTLKDDLDLILPNNNIYKPSNNLFKVIYS